MEIQDANREIQRRTSAFNQEYELRQHFQAQNLELQILIQKYFSLHVSDYGENCQCELCQHTDLILRG